MMIKNIYICGNELLENDNLPYRLLPFLKEKFPEISFLEFDPTEDFPEDDTLFIIDSVLNTESVILIRDLNQLDEAPKLTAHDADLAFNLKMLRKLGKLKGVLIFGIPAVSENEAEVGEQLVRAIRSQLV